MGVVSTSFNITGAFPHLSTRMNPRTVQLVTQLDINGGFATTSTVTNTYRGYTLSLSNCANYATYTALFDQYKFLSLEMWIIPSCSMATPGAPEGGLWVSGIDIDDATTPSSYNSVQAMQGVVQTSVLSAHYHKWAPASAISAYGGGFGSYASEEGLWLDSSSAGIEQYGVKAAYTTSTTAITFTYIVRATVAFRGIAA